MENYNRKRIGECQLVIKVTLCELKKIVEVHMKKELDIFEMMFTLGNDDIEKFYEWYINHPYCKGVREIQELVRGRANKGN